MSRMRGTLLLAGCVLLTSSSARAEIGVTKQEILIGSCLDLQSPSGERGKKRLAAANAYFDEVNEKGGVHGRKLKLLALDDSYDAEKAVACFNQLTEKGVFATAFFIGSAAAVKHAALATSQKIPALGFNAGPGFLFHPVRRYVFNSRGSTEDEIKSQIDILWNDLGIRKVAVLYQDDAFGASVLTGAKNTLAAHQGKLAGQASFSRTSEGVKSAVIAVRALNPEVVFLGAIGPPAAEVLKEARKADWRPLFITTTNDPALVKQAGEAADGVVVIQMFPPASREDLPAVARANKLLKKYAPEIKPDFVTTEAYIDAVLLVEGLKRAGADLTREKLVDALQSIKDLDVGLGAENKASYGPDDHKALGQSYFTWLRGGRIEEISNWNEVIKGTAAQK